MRLDEFQRDVVDELARDLVEMIADFLDKGRPIEQAKRYVAEYGYLFGRVCGREGMREEVALHLGKLAYRVARRRWRAAGRPVEVFDEIMQSDGKPHDYISGGQKIAHADPIIIVPAHLNAHPVNLPSVKGRFDA